jgi:hypothetical protein
MEFGRMKNIQVWMGWVLLGVLASSEVQAFKLTISNRVVTAPGDATLLNSLADSLENQFNSNLASVGSQEGFLREVGNANAISGRSFLGSGLMAANRDFFFSYGFSGGLSLGESASLSSGISTPANSLPPVGLSAKGGFTVGVSAKKFPKLVPLDPSRVMYFASFSNMDLSSLVGRGISIDSLHAALGMSYQYYPSQDWTPLLRFNGFRITSGLAYSNLDVRYSTPFQLSQQSGGTTMDWSGTVDLAVDSNVWSLTNEVITGFRLFWIWNLYGGIGIDFNVGSSGVTGTSTGPVTAPQFSGTAVVSGAPESAAPTWVQTRAILGTQLDLGPIGIFGQATISTPSVYGLSFGASLTL